MRLNKKIIITIISLLILSIFFVACTGDKEASESQESETADNVDSEIKKQFILPINQLIETYKKGEHVEGVQPDFPEGAEFPEIKEITDFRADYDSEQGVYFIIIDLKGGENKTMLIMISPTDNEENPFVINGVGFSDNEE